MSNTAPLTILTEHNGTRHANVPELIAMIHKMKDDANNERELAAIDTVITWFEWIELHELVTVLEEAEREAGEDSRLIKLLLLIVSDIIGGSEQIAKKNG